MGYVAAIKGLRKEEGERQIAEVLEAVELADVSNQNANTLSGGMKQRMALAQAGIGKPETLILDEPMTSLDPELRIVVRNFIAKIALQKIVITGHCGDAQRLSAFVWSSD